MMEDHLKTVRLLESKVKEALIEEGFDLQKFQVILDEDHNDTLHLKVRISPGLLKSDVEQVTDSIFEDIMKNES